MSGPDKCGKINVGLVDNQPLFREGVAMALGENEFSIVGTGCNGSEAIMLAQSANPQVLLMEFNIPYGGIPLIRRLSEEHPRVEVVILSLSESDKDVTEALEAGASGYLLKSIAGADLRVALRKIAQGELYIMPQLGAKVIADIHSRSKAVPVSGGLALLTKREGTILERVAAGQTNKEIARALNLTEKTVKHYMTNIMGKLQVRNRVEAASIRLQSALD